MSETPTPEDTVVPDGTDDDLDADTAERVSALSGAARSTGPGRRRKQATSRWVRWIHVWTSMISLLIVLFFGLTGITLNHPDWTFGDAATRDVYTGTLPEGWDDNGTIDFLNISEYVRNTYDVKGAVGDYSATTTDGLISYKAPGYAADLSFAVPSGTFTLTIEQQGFVAVMNDLHKGRDTDSSWSWVIDVSGGFLVVVALSGLGIQLFQKKRRRSSLLIAGGATIVTIVLIYIAMR